MMTQKIGKTVILFVTAALILASCATVKFEAKRTPTLDTTGIQRIAIMPFEASDSSYRTVASYATNVARAKIAETGHFTLVDPNEIQRLRQAGQSIESHVDALFTGQITRIGQNATATQGQRTDRSTGVTTTYTIYAREVEVQFNYGFTRARDGSLIGPVNKTGRSRSSSEDQSRVSSAEVLANQAIDNQLRLLARDVAPYTITLARTLEKEANKELQPQMKAAQAQVKEGAYKAALDTYLGIYNENKNIAAAINASILYEALGETRTAANFMQDVLSATGNPKARDVLARLNRELQEMAGAAEYDDTRRQVEKVADYAKGEIQKTLPTGAKVWIHNNASSDQSMVNDVVDSLTAGFVSGGVTVIDRQSIELIMRERNFQLSGEVSDNDIVSIGNMAGANTIVIINITGTGATRRLQVRVLDVARGTLLFTSDTSENWAL